MLTTYTADGATKNFAFDWPYLDRSHIAVTRNGAAALFKFTGDHEVSVHTLYGDPLPAGEVIKIFRVTPDLDAFAEFKDGAKLTADDLNRSRLQLLFLIQERSGGVAGSVSQVISTLTNELETVSGALDDLAYSQGILTRGLQTLDELQAAIKKANNEAAALRDQLNFALIEVDGFPGLLKDRIAAVTAQQQNLQTQVSENIASLMNVDAVQAAALDTLAANDALQTTRIETLNASVESSVGALTRAGEAIAARVDKLTAQADADAEALAASVIQSAVAQVKDGVATATRIDRLTATVRDVSAEVSRVEQVSVSADKAMAARVDTVAAQLADASAKVEQMSQAYVLADKAVATRVDTLIAKLADSTARIEEVSQTASKADEALAAKLNTLSADLLTSGQTLNAKITETQQAQARADESLAARITTMSAELGASDASLAAKITDAQKTLTTTDEALASQLAALSAKLTTTAAALEATASSESQARVREDSALAQRLDTVNAELTQNVATLGANVKRDVAALVKTDEGLASDITALSARLTTATSDLTAGVSSAAQAHVAGDTALGLRLDAVRADMTQGLSKIGADVTSNVAALVKADSAQASRVDSLEASVKALGADDTAEKEAEALAASIIQAAVAQVKDRTATVKRIDAMEAKVAADISAMIQREELVRADADSALAKQLTTLQASMGDNIAQVTQDIKASVVAVGRDVNTLGADFSVLGKNLSSLGNEVASLDGNVKAVGKEVVNLNAQYVLKTQVVRADGKPVVAGIALAATASTDYTGSEIVLTADRLLFVDPKAPQGTLRPLFISGSVDGSPTFIIPASVMGDKQYPGRLFVDGAIEARHMAAKSVSTDALQAGAVQLANLDVNLGTNLLKSSAFVDGLNGWEPFDSLGGVTFGVNGAGDDWHPQGENVVSCLQANDWYSGSPYYEHYAQVASAAVPAMPGVRYEFSAYTAAHRCTVVVILIFRDAAGRFLTEFKAVEDNVSTASGGTALAGYKRLHGFCNAPQGAASVQLALRKGATHAGNANSWMFCCQPMLAVALPNQTRPSPYGPSGLGTRITPAGISTPSLEALSARIGRLRTADSGARTEITDNLITVFDSNNVMRVRMGVW